MVETFMQVLEAFAVGDAMGMPTEFMTLEEIRQKFGIVDTLLDPCVSPIHNNLRRGKITDDTEQVLYLIETFHQRRGISVEATVEGLCLWIEETHADEKGYVGPSTLKALREIQAGRNPREVNSDGTTCGAAMRALVPALCVERGDLEQLKKAVWACSVPTHDSSIALEAAMAISFGYHFAALGADFSEIVGAILDGAEIGRKMSENQFVGAYTRDRVELSLEKLKEFRSHEELLDFVYRVIGTTMESNEVVPAAITIFAYSKEDVWLAIQLGASVGGDTDTIAAIAGALSCLYAGRHNIPREIVDEVIRINRLDLSRYAEMMASFFNPNEML